jgi:hypothetical protein
MHAGTHAAGLGARMCGGVVVKTAREAAAAAVAAALTDHCSRELGCEQPVAVK